MNTATAPRGRERTCNQCGAVYRSPRSSSLYCSTPCRKKAGRATAPTGPKAGPAGWGPIPRALYLTGYIGRIGPSHKRSDALASYAMLVDAETAFTELAHQFNRKGWGLVSREEFGSSLRSAGVQGYNTRSPEALELNRYRARQRERMLRAA